MSQAEFRDIKESQQEIWHPQLLNEPFTRLEKSTG
jgi:hypothetical protein